MVQLLFPIEKGDEFERLVSVAPDAKLVVLQGRSCIQVGEFADAKVAYRLGKSLQRRFRIPFELAYDPGHPQSNFAWLQELQKQPQRPRRSTVIAQEPARVPVRPSTVPPTPSTSGRTISRRAGDLQTQANGSSLPGSIPNSQRTGVQPVQLPPSAAGTGSSPLRISSTPSVIPPRPVRPELPVPNIISPIESLRTERALNQPVPDSERPATTDFLPMVNQLLPPEASQGVALLQRISSNPDLIYLYADVNDRSDLNTVSGSMSVTSEYRDSRGRWLIQVGVYQPSRIGRQLLEADLERLRNGGITAVVYENNHLLASRDIP